MVRCPDCGFGWTDPAPGDHEIGRWYPAAYYGRENVRFNPWMEALTRWFRRRRAGEIARRTPSGRVLDVGCGRGLVLGTLKGMGYETHGVERSEEAAWHARHRMGATMHVGDFMTVELEPGSFDAIVLWHSLEHLRKPVDAIRRARALLRTGGLLAVAVPNSDSLQAKAYGASWFHLDVPRHYVHFGTRALGTLLAQSGFRTETISHLGLEQNPYGGLQSAYNALGFEWNLLYTILKSPTARATSIRAHPIQAALTLALLPPLLPVSLALSLIETAMRRGGTIEVYAFKE